MIARIAVAAAVYAIDKPYSYRVPEGMDVRPGMRVRLPFGAGNRRTEGVVLALEQGDETGLKAIDVPLDESPVLSEGMLHLAGFLRERYFCTLYDAVRAILPAGLWFSENGTAVLTDPLPDGDWVAELAEQKHLSNDERLLLDECMKRLSDEERMIIVQHAVIGFKHQEIADDLDLPLSTVLSKYRRALMKLRTAMLKGDSYDV